jgi:hypothetical protein
MQGGLVGGIEHLQSLKNQGVSITLIIKIILITV